MFEQEVTRILDYVAKGISVRVIGAPGSGRTMVATMVVTDLEDQGVKVYSIFATPSLRSASFAGILSLGLDLRSRPTGILGVADLVSAELSRPGTRVFVIDDVENLDSESMAVVDVVQKRTQRPLVTTMSNALSETGAPALALGRWPEAIIELKPLRFGQVNSLITGTLGAPAEVNVVARILTKSGGNLRLAMRIIHSAVLSNRLVFEENHWRMAGDSLLNEHLRGTVEALIHGLGRDELRALDTIAIFGSHPLDEPRRTIDANVLDSLERRGRVSVVTGPDGRLYASVFPPLLADYLRNQVLGSRMVLSSTVVESGALPPAHLNLAVNDDGISSELFPALKKSSFNSAAAIRHFNEQVQTLEQGHYRTWDSDRSVANAAAFLRVYWGAPIDPPRIQNVFENTDATNGDPADILFFTMTRALWAVLSDEGLEHARDILMNLTKNEPQWAAEAEAFALILEASYNRVPHDIDEIFSRLTSRNPSSGVIAAVQGMLELYRFNPERALEIIDSAEGFESLPRFEPLIRGLAMFASGQVDEALGYALERREEALQSVDQFSLITTTYIATLALLYRGRFEEAEYLMGWTFSVRKPSFLLSSLHNALLRLSSLRDGANEASLASQVGWDSTAVGPLPATGKGVYDLATRSPAGADAFDDSASKLLDEQLEHGFVFEAVFSALFLLCLLPGPRIKKGLRRILEERGITRHDQLLAFADASLDNLRLLDKLLENYEPDEDCYQIGMLLRGAAVRYRLIGEAIAATALERAAKEFTVKFLRGEQYMHFDPKTPVSALSVREREVALLAGQQSNHEIADQLGLSVRTVESHISNALRKTQTPTRNALFELVRYALDKPPVTSEGQATPNRKEP
jgi:DNA-binding CsgD family transcriptional regulator